MISLIRRVLDLSGSKRGSIRLAFVLAFVKSILSKAPIILSFIILAIFFDGAITAAQCLWVGIAFLICLAFQMVLQNATDRLQSGAGYEIFAQKRLELGRHLLKLPMGFFTEGNIGKISSVLSVDMAYVEQNCMGDIANMMNYVFSEIVMIVLLCAFSPYLGLAAVIVSALVLLTARGMKRTAIDESVKRQEQSEKLTSAVIDFAEGIAVAKTYNLLGERARELTGNFARSRETSIAFERRYNPWFVLLNLLYGLGAVAIVALSFCLNAHGMLQATMLIGMLLFVYDLFGPFRALYNQSAQLTIMSASLDRMDTLFAEVELSDGGAVHIPDKADPAIPEVVYDGVRFAYSDKEVLHGISFAMPGNTMTALVGPSGSGKSTAASLLARFWDVTDGSIRVRGADVRDVPLAELMDNLSMVFQRVYLFQDTVFNNIAFGKPGATREEVVEAARKARCLDFIEALPDGFDTMVGEGGANLSGGEKQRISIARCILKDAPIVILDEATASVDPDNESYIQEAITELVQGKTLLVIAHRLGTVRDADQILVMRDGKIVESGTDGELLEAGGLYARYVELLTSRM